MWIKGTSLLRIHYICMMYTPFISLFLHNTVFLCTSDQGWMLLRYPFGDYIEECKDYAVTEILLTCSDQDRTVSGGSDCVQ